MGKIMRELLEKDKALQLAREVERAKQDSTKEISITKATTIVAQQYKKAQSLAAKQGKEHCKNNVNDILTDKVDVDNSEVFDKTEKAINEFI